MVAMPRPIRICLIMHSTKSDNMGVGALTVSEVAILRGIAATLGRDIEITVADWKDARAPYVTGPDIRVVEMDGRFLINTILDEPAAPITLLQHWNPDLKH